MDDLQFFSSSEEVPLLMSDNHVVLQVGERRFHTTAETLSQESGFFSALLSQRWDNAQPDGSYFVDADPDIFVHILRYLRRGILPVFYEKAKGFDFDLYLGLLGEARYFQIERLQQWIEKQRFFNAVMITYEAKECDGPDSLYRIEFGDTDIEYHPFRVTIQTYMCPRGIEVHNGAPEKCGKACSKSRGDGDGCYVSEEKWKTMVIEKTTSINMKVAIAD